MKPSQPPQSDEQLMSGEVGKMQRASVKEAIKNVPNVIFTAGNHDIGDVPDTTTVAAYQRNWGPLHSSFESDDILYLQLTSQLYWDHSLSEPALSPDMEKKKAT